MQLLRGQHTAPLTMENRNPARMPELSWSWRTIPAFPGRFQAYYDDNFGLRAELLRLQAAARFRLFGVSPARGVIVGKGGWLYCSADRSAEAWRGLYPFTPDEIDSWLDVLEQRHRWLAERGIAYVFAIAPNKEDIYPEHLPDSLNRVGPTRLDELLARASQRDGVDVVDLRPALLAEKQHDGGGDPVYFPGDTHWSWHGAWAASNALLAELHGQIPAPEPPGREHLVPRLMPFISGDLDREVGRLSPLQRLPPPAIVEPRARAVACDDETKLGAHFSVDDPCLPRVLLLHDSFGPFLFPYLAEHCSELYCLWDYSLPEDVVGLLRPEAVIQIYTERNLVQAPVPMHTAVRLLERSACDGLDELLRVGGVDPERALLVPRGSTTLAPVAPGESPGIAIETKVETDMFATPPVVLPPGSRPVLHIDITVARATALSVWYQTRQVERFVRRNACQVVLPAGRSDVCFEMCVDAVAGPLLVRPSLQPGRCILHGLAISASKP